MARVCTVTGRRTKTGNARSHAMNASKRTWKSNVQKVKILVNGKPKKSIRFCSRIKIRKSRTRLLIT